MENQVRLYLAEFVGTFALVLVGTSVAVVQGMSGYGGAGWLGIAAAFGGVLAVLVLVIGPVSGCHVNPAVTIPMALSGRLKPQLAPGYIIAQVLGAVAASAVLLFLMKGLPGYSLETNGLGTNGNARDMSLGSLIGLEVVLTALFLFTIFAATREDATPGFAAIAIGGFLFLAHLVATPLDGTSLNPARSLGPALLQRGDALNIVWVFCVAPIIGGIIGWLLYRFVYED